MKLLKVYEGTVTKLKIPCKIALVTDGINIKVFQKEFYRNNLNRKNWYRKVILESFHSPKLIESKLISWGFICTKNIKFNV